MIARSCVYPLSWLCEITKNCIIIGRFYSNSEDCKVWRSKIMGIAKGTAILLLLIVPVAILVATVFSLLDTDQVTTKTAISNNRVKIGNTTDHLLWFLQISDIHISKYQDPERVTDLKEFCSSILDAIKPPIVVVSGDLTDAKTLDKIGLEQIEDEWTLYANALEQCKVKNRTLWLDIRGNHDDFNVANAQSKQNLFKNYAIQGHNPRSYMHQIRHGGDLYSFIAIDACPQPGPKPPFNFFGQLDQAQIDEISSFVEKTKSSGSNYTVWFGHYPTSFVLSGGNEGIRNLIQKDSKGVAYLCGHLHKFIPKMYTLQKEGFLELELADWKDNRMYRLMAIDHGMLSFLDVKFGDSLPLGLITNPKHGLFINTAKENVKNIEDSTHIRVLAFSPDPITLIQIRIDGGQWVELHHVQGPLYVLEWNPKQYNSGVHNIDLYIQDAYGREKVYTQPFILDDTRLPFNLNSRIILMIDVINIFRFLFILGVIMCVSPLIVLRILHKKVEAKKMLPPRLKGGFSRLWLRKFWLLVTTDRFFWPVILYPLILSFGPWTIGYIVEDHLGIIFAWGIYVNGSYLLGSVSYVYGFIQLLVFQIPLTLVLAHSADYKFQANQSALFWRLISIHLPFIIILGVQVEMAHRFWLAFGTISLLLGPLRTGSVILAAILWYNAVKLPKPSTKKTAKILRTSE